MQIHRIYSLFYTLVVLWLCMAIAPTAQAQHTINDIAKGITSKSSKKPSTKAPKKTGMIANKFQDLTTRYNRYFNANLRYTEGIQTLEKSHKDDYSDILSIYAYKGGDGSSITGNLDEAIKKTSIAIQKKPNSKWVDDCYLLIGKSYYLKGEYDSATESFQYIIKNYSNNIRRSYDRQSQEKMRKLKEEERKATQKDKQNAREELLKQQQEEREQREKERKETAKTKEKEREEAAKEKAKERKETLKEREQTAKEKAKERKETLKEREQTAKEKAKERERMIKEKEKERKQRAKDRAKGIKTPPKTDTDEEKTNAAPAKDPRAEKEKAAAEKAQKEADAKAAAEKAKKDKEDKENAKKEAEAAEKAQKEADAKAAAEEEANAKSAALQSVVQNKEGDEKKYKRGGLLQHKLAKFEAMLWLARNYMDNNQLSESQAVLETIEKDKNFPKRLKGQLMTLYAHQYMNQNKYDKAKEALNIAVKSTSKREGRARLHYVLAQLEAQDDNHSEALKHFQKVLKSRPSFEMEFYAQLNVVKSKLKSNEMNASRALATLEKMANETKNSAYADLIYFEMSEIASQSGDEALAAKYLEKSATAGGKDPKQKSLSYLRLAHVNYDKEKYLLAASYYDSSLVALPKTHKDYETAKTRAEVLGNLAKSINTITLQDSLQRIAKMPQGERDRYIDDLIAQLQFEARKRAEEQQFLAEQNENKDNNATNNSQFYFYNEAAKGMGYNEFINKWGNRPLVDNWRLLSKISGSPLSGNDTSSTTNSREDLIARAETLTKEDILKQLPLSKQAMAASDSLIIAAYYNIGNVFHSNLGNDPKAIEALEKLLQRFPNNEYQLQTHYLLYSMYAEAGNTEKANLHKNYILNNHPNSVFAKMLLDPQYAKNIALEGNELEQYYQATYNLHVAGNYDAVLQRCNAADSLYNPNTLKPKFDLLRAFALGKTKDKNAYVSALQSIVLQYPNDEVKNKAQEILSYLESAQVQAANAANTSANAAKYKYEPNSKHYVIIVPEGSSQQVATLSKNISDFNQANFSADQLKTNQMLLDPEHQIVLIKEFANSTKAQFYYNAVLPQSDVISGGISINIFMISKTNFSNFFKDKDVAAYLQFFTENYK
jgi:tetratricopeptide (TPR) repeat protein